MLLSSDCTAGYLATGQQPAIEEDTGLGTFSGRPELHSLLTLEKARKGSSTVEADYGITPCLVIDYTSTS